MKNKAYLMGLMALAMIGPHPNFRYGDTEYNEPVKNRIPKGHKEFNINGQIVYALNYKNALKKVKKLNKL